MLRCMRAQSVWRAVLLAALAAVIVSGCSLPPLHRSVNKVEVDHQGVPVHASGDMAENHYTVVRGDTLYSIAFRAHVDYHNLARWNGISAPYEIHPGQDLRLTKPDSMPTRQPSAPVFEPVDDSGTGGAASKTTQAVASSGSDSESTPATTATTGTTSAAGTDQHASSSQEKSNPVHTSSVVAVAGKKPVTDSQHDSGGSVDVGATREVAGITWSWPLPGSITHEFSKDDPIQGIEIAADGQDEVRAAADGVVVYSGNGLVGYGELVIVKHNAEYLSAYGHNAKRLVEEGQKVKAGEVIARAASTQDLEFQIRHQGNPVNPLNYLPNR